MRLENVEKLKPLKDGVVVDVQVDYKVLSSLNFLKAGEGINMRFGTVESLADGAQALDACPGVDVGDIVIFNEFAGYHIATNDKHLHKILDGYSIMAKTKSMKDLTVEDITPINSRVLVEVRYQYVDADGLVLDDVSAKDPRLEDISFGVITKLGTNPSSAFKIGDLIGYPPYAGETIRPRSSEALPELRILLEESILFINGN